MANPKASALYTRSKGLTEQALAELGYKDTVIFRPAALSGTQRSDSRPAEKVLL
jgi:oxidoreductase